MELAIRKANDRFVPPGAYREIERELRGRVAGAEIPTAVLSCFDRSTRLLPFVLYDKHIFPLGARSLAGSLCKAGFPQTRAIFQLWNPNFRPSSAKVGGQPLQMLLVSSMKMHANESYKAIRDAWTMGDQRPLILLGGPKSVYEPYDYWPLPGHDGRPIGPDVVVTGEQFVLLDLLNVVTQHQRRGEPIRLAFERARLAGALDSVPGLVYLAKDATWDDPVLVDTGLQRLVQCFDEYPDDVLGLSLMEPRHRGAGLSAKPLSADRVRRHARINSILLTQGCRFNCSYCPIPAYNQKSWRFRSPENVAHQLKTMVETYGLKYFFGADDNFFNYRKTAEEILTAITTTTACGGFPLGTKVRLNTEATQFDTWKNRDLLPLASAAGLRGIWFGIEDLTAELINKGQKPEVTVELFREMHKHKLLPMAMMMFHEGQPFYTRNSLYGLWNQVDFLRKAGAVSLQVTIHTPATGTREYEKTFESGRVIKSLGKYEIPESQFDGSHVVVTGSEAAWKRQAKLWAGYAAFYNPLNLVKGLLFDRGSKRKHRAAYQALGFLATLWTGLKTLPHLARLMTQRPRFYTAAPQRTTVPVVHATQSFPRLPIIDSASESEPEETYAATAA